MEIHPIIEKDVCPSAGFWYVVSALGDCPTTRVGHTCTFIKSATEGDNGKLYIIGGANPSGSFCDTYTLDLNTLSWDTLESSGFKARYEHAAFIPACHPRSIYIFGGADQTGNMNDIQVLNTERDAWVTLTVGGIPPCPRTFHTSVVVGDRFIVFSGGQSMADPVGDRQVHCFNATDDTWSVLQVKGDSPKSRHGHVMVAVENKVYVHGGMAGTNFFNDLHCLDLDKNSWSHVRGKRVYPSARAAHGGVASGSRFYVFGGMNRDGALHDTFMFDTETQTWSPIELQGPPPASRLDFGICTIDFLSMGNQMSNTADLMTAGQQARDVLQQELKPGSADSRDSVQGEISTTGLDTNASVLDTDNKDSENPAMATPTVESATANNSQASAGDLKSSKMCLVHGGMDTEGELYNDLLILLIEP